MSEPQNQSGSGRTYPLSAIFAVTAVCAVLFGMLRSLASPHTLGGPANALAAVLLGAIVGGFLGWWVGIYHRPWFACGWLGVAAGACAGAVTVPLVLAPAAALVELWVTMLIGSALLVTAGLVMRFTSATELPTPYLAGWKPGIEAELADRDLAGEPPYLAGCRPPLEAELVDPPPAPAESRADGDRSPTR